jgi:hypothetical protein
MGVVLPFPMHRVRRGRAVALRVFAAQSDTCALEAAATRLTWTLTLVTLVAGALLQIAVG